MFTAGFNAAEIRALWTRSLVPLLVVLVLLNFQSSAWASDRQAGKPGARKLATVSPTVVAPPSALLSGGGGAVSFQGGSPTVSAGHVSPRPSPRHQAVDPIAQIQPALKELKADATSACAVVKERLEKLTGTRVDQVTAWTARMYKQFMSPPVMTPAAGPYVIDRYMHAPLYVTRDGRLKTVVAR